MREEDINVIERFIIFLYYDDSNCFSVDLAQYEIFNYQQNMEIQSFLPIGEALIQHIHKSAYVSGYIWGRANSLYKTDESLSRNYTWNISSDKVLCTWISPNNIPLLKNLAKKAFKKCGCRLKCKM